MANANNMTNFSEQKSVYITPGFSGNDFFGVKKYNTARAEWVSVTPAALTITKVTKNIVTKKELVCIAFKAKSVKVWQNVTVDRAVIASKSKIVAALASVGAGVNSENAKYIVEYFAAILDYNADKLKPLPCVNTLGWYNGNFVPFDKDVEIENTSHDTILKSLSAPAGTFGEYKIFFAKLLSCKDALRMSMAAGLASALVGWFDGQCFIFYLWGTTNYGKSVCMQAAASVWGNPKDYVKSVDGTENSHVDKLAYLHHLPYMIDEMQTNVDEYKDDPTRLVMRLCNGIERGRLDSNANSRSQRQWRNTILINGEKPLLNTKSGGGAYNRVLEYHLDMPIASADELTKIFNFCQNNYGHLGRAFISYIKENATNMEEKRQKVLSLLSSDICGKQLNMAAMCILAETIMLQLMLDETPQLDEISNRWLSLCHTNDEISVAVRAWTWLKCHIVENHAKFESEGIKATDHTYWGSIEKNKAVILKNVLERELEAGGYNFREIKSDWQKTGILVKQSNTRYSYVCNKSNIKGQCYLIDLDK